MNIILIPVVAAVVAIVGGRIITKAKEKKAAQAVATETKPEQIPAINQ